VRSRGKVAVGYLEFSFHRFKPILEEVLVEDEGLTTLRLSGCSGPHSDATKQLQRWCGRDCGCNGMEKRSRRQSEVEANWGGSWRVERSGGG